MNIVVIEWWIDLFGVRWFTDRQMKNYRRQDKQTRVRKKFFYFFIWKNEPSHFSLEWAIIENWKTRIYTIHTRLTERPTDYPICFFIFCWFVVVFFRFYLFFFAVHHNIFIGLLVRQFALYVWCSTAFLIQFGLVFRSKSNVFFLQVPSCYNLTKYWKIFKCDFNIDNRQ